MAERKILSGSSGTFWGLVEDGEWTKLLLSEASVIRTTDRSGPDPVVSSYSDNGSVNSVTVKDVNARLNSGVAASNTGATYFGFPLLEQGGDPVNLGSDQFTLDFFIEVTANPGDTDNNKVIIGMGVNDGDKDFQGGRLGAAVVYDNAFQPRFGTFSEGGGLSVVNSANIKYFRATTTTTAVGEEDPFQWITITAYGDSNERISVKQSQGTGIFGNLSSRPTGSNAYVFVTIGKNGTSGGGDENFSFKAYYRIDMLTFNGIGSARPG